MRALLLAFALTAGPAALLPGVAVAAPVDAAAEPDPTTVQELIGVLKRTYTGVKSLEAAFTQVQRSPVAGEVRAKGKVQVKQPRMARWETLGEQGSLFITDGKQMTVYTPAAKQALVYPDLGVAGGGNIDVLGLLSDISKLDQHFDVKLVEGGAPGDKKSFLVEAVPRAAGTYKKVVLVFSRKKYDLERVAFVDQMGGETELTFTNVRLNPPLDDARFQFSPPPGTQVIQNAGP